MIAERVVVTEVWFYEAMFRQQHVPLSMATWRAGSRSEGLCMKRPSYSLKQYECMSAQMVTAWTGLIRHLQMYVINTQQKVLC
jgi:hypothetical protein